MVTTGRRSPSLSSRVALTRPKISSDFTQSSLWTRSPRSTSCCARCRFAAPPPLQLWNIPMNWSFQVRLWSSGLWMLEEYYIKEKYKRKNIGQPILGLCIYLGSFIWCTLITVKILTMFLMAWYFFSNRCKSLMCWLFESETCFEVISETEISLNTSAFCIYGVICLLTVFSCPSSYIVPI